MLQDIRDNAQGTIAKVIIGLLIVSLSIWGMDAIIGGFSSEPEVATVNGQDITEREFTRMVQIQTQRQLAQMENPDPAAINEDQLRKDVLEGLINQTVLVQEATAQGLELTPEDIDAMILATPQFQVDGTFDRNRFEAIVRNMGLTVSDYRLLLARETATNQIAAGISMSAFVSERAVERLMALQNQTRDLRVFRLNADLVSDQVEVTDADIETYYNENESQFRTAEQVDAQYVVLSVTTLADPDSITQEQISQRYQEMLPDLAQEERQTAHILIEDPARAAADIPEIQERLANGEEFAVLAKEYSDDVATANQGGDLGYVGRGVFDENYEQAMFALEPGQVSEPVQSSFGTHLIKLLDVRKADAPELAEVEGQIRQTLAEEAAAQRYADLRTSLSDSAYSENNLESPAEEAGLEVQTQTNVTRDSAEAPLDHPGLLRQLFSEDVLSEGFNTELVEVAAGESVVARVGEYRPAAVRPLADVRDEIAQMLTRQRTNEALDEMAKSLVANLEAGQSLEQAGPEGAQWEEMKGLGRQSQELSIAARQRAFSLQQPEEGVAYGYAPSGEGVAVIALDNINAVSEELPAERLAAVREFLAQQQGQQEYVAFAEYLRNRADIERPGQ